MKQQQAISGGSVSFFTIPTDAPEADGTFSWDSTSMVLVQLESGRVHALGFTYADAGTAALAHKLLHSIVLGSDPMRNAETRQRMLLQVRNLGECGMAAMAVSALDNALWDLHAQLLDVPLVSVLGQVRTGIPVYGSGGFTTYSDKQLNDQLGGWAEQGLGSVKMKVGTHPELDPARVRTAREAIGSAVNLFVDANGAYTVTQAIALAHTFAESGVRWFEEPVSSDDLVGLNQVRERAPLDMDIAAGEYGYSSWYFERMLKAQAVTVLQADCTRCGGMSGFIEAAALSWAHNIPLSSHCGPSMHLHVCCSVPRAVHMEYFHDHVRIERMFFDGFVEPKQGCMVPDLTRPGMGLTLKQQDADKFRR